MKRFKVDQTKFYALTILAVACLEGRTAWSGGLSLRQVQVTGPQQIDLLFDGKVTAKQIQTEFFNDTIQFSMNDVTVYPAKIQTLKPSPEGISKIFAYQYTPKQVRCRLTVAGKAEDYQRRVETQFHGRVMTVQIRPLAEMGHSDSVGLTAAKPDTTRADVDESALMRRVLGADAKPEAKPEAKSEAKTEKSNDSKRLTTGKALPGLGGIFLKFLGVLGLLVAVLFIFVKKRSSFLSLGSAVGGMKKLTQKGKIIEVVSTHYLGPKKSIAVVRVSGKQLVLGVTDESITLITQIGENSHLDAGDVALDAAIGQSLGLSSPSLSQGTGAVAAGSAVFADVLGQETSQPASSAVRNRIRSRLEGLKSI